MFFTVARGYRPSGKGDGAGRLYFKASGKAMKSYSNAARMFPSNPYHVGL